MGRDGASPKDIAKEANSMTLIQEKSTLRPPALPQVSAAAGTGHSDPSHILVHHLGQ